MADHPEENNSDKSVLADWLEALQQESWQLELLISGLALYGIIGSSEMVDAYGIWIEHNTVGVSNLLGDLSWWVARTAWMIGTINLVAHIFLRGFWIGAIGLRYVSGDIDYKKLNYSPYFRNLFARKIGSYDEFIERLERLCSTIFAYTFLLFFIFLSWCLFLLPLALSLAFNFEDGNTTVTGIWGVLITLYMFLGFIVFVDFITGGLFKRVRNPAFERVYGFIYRVFSALTLSFLYRPILFNFLDNSYTRRWFFLSIPYILLITVLMPRIGVESNPYFPPEDLALKTGTFLNHCYYDDLRMQALSSAELGPLQVEPCDLADITMREFYVEDDQLVFFVSIGKNQIRSLNKNEDIEPFFERGMNLGEMFDEYKRPEHIKLKEKVNAEVKKLYKQKVDERHKKQDANQGLIDSLNKEIDSLNKQLSEDLREADKRNAERIKTALLKSYSIKVDGIEIDAEVQSFFHIHPYLNQRGILCHYPIADLAKGLHEISYEERRVTRSTSELISSTLKSLPWMRTSAPAVNNQTVLPGSTP